MTEYASPRLIRCLYTLSVDARYRSQKGSIIIMQTATILPFHFDMITLLGIWCPTHWSPLRRYFQKIHLFLVTVAVSTIIILQLARLLFVKLTFSQFNDTFYIMMSTYGAFYKFYCNVVNRKKILQLIDMFQETCCLARDDFERSVKQKYDDTCRKIGKALLAFVELNVVLFLMASLSSSFEHRRLPYKVMQLYSLSSPLVYWLTYVHHVFAAVLLSGVHIVTDAIIIGFMFQLCGQLELVAYRLGNLPDQARKMYCQRAIEIVEKCLIRETVKHHVHIYKIAEEMAKLFNSIIIMQFYITTLQICMIVYQLTTRVTNIFELLLYSFFLVRTTIGLYAYCYFGNELSIKSINLSDRIFHMDWSSLSLISRKNLAFMIFRSSKSIEISDRAFVRLTMETFTLVIKTSYSAFSVLTSSR